MFVEWIIIIFSNIWSEWNSKKKSAYFEMIIMKIKQCILVGNFDHSLSKILWWKFLMKTDKDFLSCPHTHTQQNNNKYHLQQTNKQSNLEFWFCIFYFFLNKYQIKTTTTTITTRTNIMDAIKWKEKILFLFFSFY